MRRLAALLATQLACGTLAGEGGGGANLPNRGVVPYARAGLAIAGEALSEPSAIVRDGRVLLYFTVRTASAAEVRRASSADGLAFGSAEVVSGLSGAVSILELEAAFDGGDCRAIRFATSADGLAFTEGPRLLEPSEGYEAGGVCRPSLVAVEGGFELYYEARDAGGRTVIARATAGPDRVFTKRGIVLEPGSGCTGIDGKSERCWDEDAIESPEVRSSLGATGRRSLRLLYGGRARSVRQIGFAASTDGGSFTRYADNPIAGDGEAPVAAPSNVRLGGVYWLYFEEAGGIAAALNDKGNPTEVF